jgi:AGZA family xanthine/uracil permease-like MFS transporter
MGGRAAYTLATAVFVAAATVFGFFSLIFVFVPKAVLFPILIFVGLEITAQSYVASPPRHYPALALGCLPAVAYLCTLFVDPLLAATGTPLGDIADPHLVEQLMTLRILAGGGGFIVTSLLWAAALAEMIDGRLRQAAGYLLVAAVCSWFGVIHSPLSPSAIQWPATVMDQIPEAARWQTPYHVAGAYLLMAAVLGGLSFVRREGRSRDQLTAISSQPSAE